MTNAYLPLNFRPMTKPSPKSQPQIFERQILIGPLFALLLSAGLLIGAWIFQYGFGYAPCQMCYWQRHAHKAVIIISLLGLIIAYHSPHLGRVIYVLIALALTVSAGLAMWHMGVEYKWWEGPKSCLAAEIDLSAIPSGTDILDALKEPIKAPGCDQIVWSFIGLSMAGWNFLLSALGALATLILMIKPQKQS